MGFFFLLLFLLLCLGLTTRRHHCYAYARPMRHAGVDSIAEFIFGGVLRGCNSQVTSIIVAFSGDQQPQPPTRLDAAVYTFSRRRMG